MTQLKIWIISKLTKLLHKLNSMAEMWLTITVLD